MISVRVRGTSLYENEYETATYALTKSVFCQRWNIPIVGLCDVIYPDTTSRRARIIVGQRKNIKVHDYESVARAPTVVRRGFGVADILDSYVLQ